MFWKDKCSPRVIKRRLLTTFVFSVFFRTAPRHGPYKHSKGKTSGARGEYYRTADNSQYEYISLNGLKIKCIGYVCSASRTFLRMWFVVEPGDLFIAGNVSWKNARDRKMDGSDSTVYMRVESNGGT